MTAHNAPLLPDSPATRDDVEDMLVHVYGAFDRPAPRQTTIQAVWEVVDGKPSSFVQAVAADLVDLPELPRNIVRYIRRQCWPAYVIGRSAGATAGGQVLSGMPDCPDCRGTGWHRVWPIDAAPGTLPVNIPCACNAQAPIDLDPQPVTGWTLADLKATGAWRWTDPADDVPVPDDGWGRDAVLAMLAEIDAAKAAVAGREARRAEYAEIQQDRGTRCAWQMALLRAAGSREPEAWAAWCLADLQAAHGEDVIVPQLPEPNELTPQQRAANPELAKIEAAYQRAAKKDAEMWASFNSNDPADFPF